MADQKPVTPPDAELALTTSGEWEVILTINGAIERRRHVESLKLAEAMVVTWLDAPHLWDSAFGDTGLAPWVQS